VKTLLISLGGSQYPRDLRLRHPCFAPSSHAVANLLTSADIGMVRPDDHLDLFDDQRSWPDQVIAIRDWLRSKFAMAESPERPNFENVIVHYVGHGTFKPNSDEHFLTINHTDADERSTTSAQLGQLNVALLNTAGSTRRYYLIDACFAAASVKDLMTPDPEGFIEVTVGALLEAWPENGRGTHGVAALCSADSITAANARGQGNVTQFTDGLLTVVKTGDPAAPNRRLTLRRVHELLRSTLKRRYGDRAVHPVLVAPEDAGGGIAAVGLLPNLATPKIQSLISSQDPSVGALLQEQAKKLTKSLSDQDLEPSIFDELISTISNLGKAEIESVPSGHLEDIHGTHPKAIFPQFVTLANEIEQQTAWLKEACDQTSANSSLKQAVEDLALWLISELNALEPNLTNYIATLRERNVALTARVDEMDRARQEVVRATVFAHTLERELSSAEAHAKANGSHSTLVSQTPSLTVVKRLHLLLEALTTTERTLTLAKDRLFQDECRTARENEIMQRAMRAVRGLAEVFVQPPAVEGHLVHLGRAVDAALIELKGVESATAPAIPRRSSTLALHGSNGYGEDLVIALPIAPLRSTVEPATLQPFTPPANDTPLKEAILTRDQRFRHAVYRFFRLSRSEKNDVLGSLGLGQAGDASMSDLARYKAVLARVRENNKIEKLEQTLDQMEKS